MPKIFYVGVVLWIGFLIAGVCIVAYLLTSPRKKKRPAKNPSHLRRRDDSGKQYMQDLVRKYRNGGPKSTANHRG